MKLSTRGQYGLKAMFVLAEEYGTQEPVSLSEIAKRQHIPENYLEQLVRELRKAGLINSIRGPKGGYLLSRAPESISVGEILRTVEGDLAPTDCAGHKGACQNEQDCATHQVWVKLYEGINDVVDGMSLSDMLNNK